MAQPSADLAAQFARQIASGNYAGAASLGRNAGYSDADIAAYTGAQGFTDKSGNAIDANAANSFLSANQPTANLGMGTTQNGAGYVPPSGPTADQSSKFGSYLSSGNFQGAADYGRSLGYNDKQIADYTGQQGFKDNNGNALSSATTSSWLGAHPAPGRQPSPQLASQFAALMNKGDYAGAQALGKTNGFSDAEIANYVGNIGFKDQSGNTITEQSAAGFMNGRNDVTGRLQSYQRNPYLDQMAQGITSQMNDNWNRNLEPSIRSGAMAAGGFGGSRQGVVEANGLNDMNRSLGQNLSNLYGQDYQAQMGRNLSQYQGDQSYNLGIGNQALGNAQLDANIYNNNFNNQLNSAQFGLNTYNTMMNNNQTGINSANNIQNTPMNYNQYFANQYNTAGGLGTTGTTQMPGNTALGVLGGAQIGSKLNLGLG
jgi:hypothetical protein